MQYVLRRLALMPLMLLGITLITYVLISLAPGDPVTALINPEELNIRSPEEIEAIRDSLGLNDPVPVRYVLWLKEAVQGNLGYSYQSDRPVADVILDRLPATILLSGSSIVLAMVTGILLGIISARKQYSVLDYLFTVLAFFCLSVPTFFFAMIGIYVFAVKLGWLPVFGMWTPGEPNTFNLDLLEHLILPMIALALPQIAEYMRYTRAATLDAMHADHVTTGRAKGLQEGPLFRRHVFRNALIPLVTIVGLSLPGVIGGSFIIETIFSWPGIGLLGYTAVLQRDYPVQIGVALLTATIVLLANLFTDIAYAFVDPRIRYG
jgi:peptide/nickel transport system permease protein